MMWRVLYNPALEYAHHIVNKLITKARNPGLTQRYLAFSVDSRFEPHVTLYERSLVIKSQLGSRSYVGIGATLQNSTVGRFVSIGPGCRIGLGRHPAREFVSTHPIFYSTRKQAGATFADRDYFAEYAPVRIGNDVWIGANVMIADGVSIADGAIVASGAVVAADVPAYAVVGGVPAKLIRRRFSDEQIAALLEFRWWDRDEAWLREHYRRFHRIDEFLDFIAGKSA
jgi:acetyltransferase-like isoleucine patch superfamily enzyme